MKQKLVLKSQSLITLYSAQASPGNLQQLEEVVLGGGAMVQSPLVLAIRLATEKQGARLVGVAYADPASHFLGVAQFVDNDLLSELQVCVCVWVCVDGCMGVCVWVGGCLRVYMYVCVGVGVSVSRCVCVCWVCLGRLVFVCMWVWLWV